MSTSILLLIASLLQLVTICASIVYERRGRREGEAAVVYIIAAAASVTAFVAGVQL